MMPYHDAHGNRADIIGHISVRKFAYKIIDAYDSDKIDVFCENDTPIELDALSLDRQHVTLQCGTWSQWKETFEAWLASNSRNGKGTQGYPDSLVGALDYSIRNEFKLPQRYEWVGPGADRYKENGVKLVEITAGNEACTHAE